ncbi:MAG TPA: hypothetical protein VIB48_12900 [Acidimicrobiia bacterium]|jgi:hypothetical protein
MTSVLFHFEVPEISPEDGAVGIARRVRDHAAELQTSCRWWRSWCDPDRDVVVLEGELAPEADVTVLDTLHELARGQAPDDPRAVVSEPL